MYFTQQSEETAFQSALEQLGISVSEADIAVAFGTPFVIVGSEEWLDRAVVTLLPRMRTTLPADLVTFHADRHAQLARYGCTVSTALVSDVAACMENPNRPADWHGVNILLPGTRAPVVWSQSAATQSEEVRAAVTAALAAAPNGALLCSLQRGAAHATPRPQAAIAQARDLLAANRIFRFPTPQHPLRLAQAWHVGIAAFEVIALAAEPAAPLAIVSDTVATVFATYRCRAAHAAQLLDSWLQAADQRASAAATRAVLAESFADIDYFYALLTTQFPDNTKSRALSIPEGELIAAVCRDLRSLYGDVVMSLRAWEESLA